MDNWLCFGIIFSCGFNFLCAAIFAASVRYEIFNKMGWETRREKRNHG